MTLKILGGSLKGRNIKIPHTKETRPVTSLLRKSLFDSCQFFIEDALVLDLFAGSGAIGIEAISRGAKKVYFIDNAPLPIACIRDNLTALKIKEKAVVLHQDAFAFLASYDQDPFHILFVDPPYPIGVEGYMRLVNLLHQTRAVMKESHIFLESPAPIAPLLQDSIASLFCIQKEKKSSTTLLYHLLPL